MAMPGRTYAAPGSLDDKYRYSHNGQEKDNDIFIGALSAEYWEYDSRIGRRWEIDPIPSSNESPYACFNNNSINNTDVSGLKSGGLFRKIGQFLRHPFKKHLRKGHLTGRGMKQGKGKGKVQGVENKSDLKHKEKSKTPTKRKINRIENGNAAKNGEATPVGYTTPFPGASAPVTGPSAAFAAKNAVSLVLKVTGTEVFLHGKADPDYFTVNNTKSEASPSEGAVTVTINGGDIVNIMGELVTPNPGMEDLWDIESIDANVKYRHSYTKWAITRDATPLEANLIRDGKYKGIASQLDANSLTGYRVQTGWQFAPPGVPGAKPLRQRSLKYIIQFLTGGYPAVDKSRP